jgi:hypothetical protein
MALPNRISLLPGLLWLTLNLALIIQHLSDNNIFLSLLHPKISSITRGLRVIQVDTLALTAVKYSM